MDLQLFGLIGVWRRHWDIYLKSDVESCIIEKRQNNILIQIMLVVNQLLLGLHIQHQTF